MAKIRNTYACVKCGNTYPKWAGKCTACDEWGTIEEVTLPSTKDASSQPVWMTSLTKPKPTRLEEVETSTESRVDMFDIEFNRVLGGGLVRGSFVLLGGEPGIGKSTLLLQTLMRVPELRSLYASGEESASQLKLRAERLGKPVANCYVYPETDIEAILTEANQMDIDLLVIDSIQTIYANDVESSPGSVAQIRECATRLLRFSKTTGIAVFVVGHITKEGSIAGPKVLEHMVDTVLLFEGDKHFMYRLLRAVKNRFGSTSEIGIYEMANEGLVPILNPSEHLLTKHAEPMSGIAISSAIEGARAMLIETQALVSSAIYSNPQRSATGFDLRRLNMLLAVLEKRSGFRLVEKDVFLNIAGGIRTTDPASDLAVISAVLSSSLDIAIPPRTCLTGEVGLAGEIRPVSRIRQRIAEAVRIGFDTILIPAANYEKGLAKIEGIRLLVVSKVDDAFRHLFTNK